MTEKKKKRNNSGFSLIEVLVGMMLVGVALLGLAQLFTYSIMNNARSDRISNASFLAQEQLDMLRGLTAEEINQITAYPIDEVIDTNNDGTIDFRRVTKIRTTVFSWEVKVYVFASDLSEISTDELIQNPRQYRVRAEIGTVISR